MNFTHLVESPEIVPDQEMLQRFNCYLIIVVLTEEMVDFVLEKVGLELKSSNSAFCWILRPVHFRTAVPGSILARMHQAMLTHKLYGQIEHSFLGVITKKQLFNSGEQGSYVPLYLHTEDDPEKRSKILREAVFNALNNSVSFSDATKIIAGVVSVAGLLREIIKE
jgi:hypothetical protein